MVFLVVVVVTVHMLMLMRIRCFCTKKSTVVNVYTVNKKDLKPVRAKSNLYSLGCQGGIAPKELKRTIMTLYYSTIF